MTHKVLAQWPYIPNFMMIAPSNEAGGATGLKIATYHLLKGRNLYNRACPALRRKSRFFNRENLDFLLNADALNVVSS